MKILHVSHNYFPAIGGAENLIKDLSEYLMKRGHEVTIYTSNALTPDAYVNPNIDLLPAGEECINGVNIKRFKVSRILRNFQNSVTFNSYEYKLPFNDIMRTIWNGPQIWGMTRAIAKTDADIVTAIPFPFLNMYYAYLAKKIKKFPLAMIPCCHPEDDFSFNRNVIYTVLKKVDAILAFTEYEKSFLVSKGVDESKVHVVGIGVEPKEYMNADGSILRKRYKIGKNPVIAYIGRKERLKGIFFLLNSMRLIWKKIPEVRLIVAGASSPLDQEIRNKVEEIQGSSRIILINDFNEEEKPHLFDACDVLVLPSKAESFGKVYLEAWMCSKPVIGCRIGAVSELVDDGKDGVLVEYGNEQGLAQSIVNLLNNRNLRKIMGENGKKKVLSQYTWDIIIKRIEYIYGDIVRR